MNRLKLDPDQTTGTAFLTAEKAATALEASPELANMAPIATVHQQDNKER